MLFYKKTHYIVKKFLFQRSYIFEDKLMPYLKKIPSIFRFKSSFLKSLWLIKKRQNFLNTNHQFFPYKRTRIPKKTRIPNHSHQFHSCTYFSIVYLNKASFFLPTAKIIAPRINLDSKVFLSEGYPSRRNSLFFAFFS